MGVYFNPTDAIPTIGRQLNHGSFAQLKAQLKPGEILIGLYDRLIYKNAVVLNQAEHAEFEQQYNNGHCISRSFYAVNLEEAKKGIPDCYHSGLATI